MHKKNEQFYYLNLNYSRKNNFGAISLSNERDDQYSLSANIDTLDNMFAKGYQLSEKYSIGEANCIQIGANGIKFGAADSRRGASAMAY